MRKRIALFMLLFISCCSMNAEAATGSIEIQLQGASMDTIIYSKVATMINGTWELEENYKECEVNLNTIENAKELEVAAADLLTYVEDKKEIETNGNKIISLQDLEEGMYLIAAESSTMEMLPTLVSVPDLAGNERKYDVLLIPKYNEKTVVPKTGWDSQETIYAGWILISLVIIVGLSCHNRFKCGKIPLNYLKVGGYRNGNDNDTKNPRCPCRFRQRGSRSVN